MLTWETAAPHVVNTSSHPPSPAKSTHRNSISSSGFRPPIPLASRILLRKAATSALSDLPCCAVLHPSRATLPICAPQTAQVQHRARTRVAIGELLMVGSLNRFTEDHFLWPSHS